MTEIVSIVIENGSSLTRAGFSNEQHPHLTFPTQYAKNNTTGEITVGDDIYNNDHNDDEIFTILNDGVIYNWDALERNWEHVFAELKVNPTEYPLVITEDLWNNKKNRSRLAELAFDKFGVPVLTILKSPIAVTYGLGRSTSLVIDIGSATTSVTPIVDGTILYKGAVHSKFAGDFINLHAFHYLQKHTAIESFFTGSESHKRLATSNLLTDFKSTMLSVSNFPIVNAAADFNVPAKPYQLPDGHKIDVGKDQVLLIEPLFHPAHYALPSVELPKESLGLTDLILSSLKKLEVSNDIYIQLLSNIVLTGGSSLFPGLEHRVLSDLSRFLPQFSIQSFANPVVAERVHAVWIGAGILASMNIFESQSLGNVEWKERGEEAVNEKFS